MYWPLEHGLVPTIALADVDRLVAAFWKAVSNPNFAEDLTRPVKQAPQTLQHWTRQRWAEPDSVFMRACKCIYLNCTSFLAILSPTASPIGGRAQTGSCILGAKVPRGRIAAHFRKLSRLAPKIGLYAFDAPKGASPRAAWISPFSASPRPAVQADSPRV